MLLRSVSLLALVTALPAAATTTTQDSDDGQPIIVTGQVDDYRVLTTTSGTKTDTDILDVPQSIAVVTGEQLADQAVRSMADLARLVPGVAAGQGEGHRDQLTIRGNNSTADFFVDGLRDDVQYYRSFYNVDRVEVHRGPNAMVFGRGGGGGLLNRITKGALLDDLLIGGSLSADSFGSAYGALDLNVPLATDTAAIRINGFYETLNNHRDGFDGDRYAINPVLGARIGGTTVQLGYEYVNDDRGVDRGIPSARTGTLASPAGPLLGFRDTYFGRTDTNRTNFEAHVVSFRSETPLTDDIRLTTQALYGDYDKAYSNIFAVTPVSVTNTVSIEGYRDILLRETLITQANLIWDGSIGGLDHTFLIGAEYTAQDTISERINGFFNPAILTAAGRRTTVTLAATPVIPPVFFVSGPTGNSNRRSVGDLEQVSAYVQEQLNLSDAVRLVAGLRYDRVNTTVTNSFTGTSASRVDDLWSPRAGLIIHPVPRGSVYVSYARSWLPQSGDQFISLDATSATLRPERFDNIEIGAKWDLTDRLTATVAVYRLDRVNTRAAGPVPGTIVQTGAQRSSGVEVALTGNITPQWSIAAGYAHNRARISETTAAAPAGRLVAQVPRHQLSLWNRYNFNDSFGLGLGISHQSAQFATISNAVRLPGYTRFDAAAFITLSDAIELQVNVENITDETYFPNAHNDNNISTGAPLNGRVTVNFRF